MKEKITELLISGVCLLAVEMGGFDIQVEPGEMQEPPSGWEQDGTDGGMLEAEEGTNGGISGDQVSESLWNSSQNKGEQDGTQEQSPGETESFGDVWNTSEEDGDSGYEEENISGESSRTGIQERVPLIAAGLFTTNMTIQNQNRTMKVTGTTEEKAGASREIHMPEPNRPGSRYRKRQKRKKPRNLLSVRLHSLQRPFFLTRREPDVQKKTGAVRLIPGRKQRLPIFCI